MMTRKAILMQTESEYSFDGLDRVLHEKARLCILTALLSNRSGLIFSDLKVACSLTDGNLSRHLSTLQEAGLIVIRKSQISNRTQTRACLTSGGRKRFLTYLELLEKIVSEALAQVSDVETKAHSSQLSPSTI